MDSWIEIRPLVQAEGVSRRRAEGEAWRAIVRERLGADVVIRYNEKGAPVLGTPNTPDEKDTATADGCACGFIGVSHTKGWVAVVWSAAGPCAVDIELKTRRISAAAAARYSIGSVADWCALEAAYKYESVAGASPDPVRISFPPHPELVVAVIR